MNIDLKSVLGECFGARKVGDDAAKLDVVSSANVASGFDVGDPAGILKTLCAAAERIVAIALRLCALPKPSGHAALPITATA